jgi:hypothetical protein
LAERAHAEALAGAASCSSAGLSGRRADFAHFHWMRIVNWEHGLIRRMAPVVPPLTSDGNADTSEPLSKWQNIGHFANETDCKNSMTAQQFAVHRYYGPIGNAQNSYEADAVKILNAQCISTEDPRLAK